ncbi:DUF1501 domain-containing protein [Tautonia marina]|uniref:DUF1501 domain-containing protein n=1 Tax=Tautonia marina TaxID=2653855 RepID=UPI0012606861|nr:DUF1501 domain-containing protein [Tautonia marina]
MLRLTSRTRRLCHGPTRREVLRIGAGSLVGLTLPTLIRAADPSKAKAKSLILFFLEGGPAHQDLWDMKPEAPENVRGEFRPIDTSLPGLQVCEHLPRTSKIAHHLTLVRSVHHSIVDHNAGAYFALTGKPPLAGGSLIVGPRPENFPPFGAVLAKLRPTGRPLPDFVHVPDWMSNLGQFLPGQDAGFLGAECQPFVSGDPSLPGYQVPGLTLPAEVPLDRLEARRSLLDAVDRSIDHAWPVVEGMDTHYRKAYELVSSRAARRAFDLSEEPESVRERYGLDPDNPREKEARQFGGLPHLGQCALLSRRLIEAGVRTVTLCTGARYDQTWDTHRQHFPLLKQSILPMFDRAFSALIEDLHDRQLLDETLVVAMGEFGRTPRVGQITSDAGADANGRDHWPHCYTALFAGGGLPAGAIFGASDSFAAYPALDPVTPQDITATIYELMGIPHDTILHDPLDRPHLLTDGRPIRALLG